MTNSTSLFVFLTALLERIFSRVRQTPAWQLRFNRVLAVSLITGLTQSVQAQVSGTVFQDFNANGSQQFSSPTEPGASGITVTAYNAAGTVVGTATTSSNGSYTVPGVTGAVRVEFSNIPASYYSGPYGSQNLTSVQFVSGPASGVNFAINNPGNYCQPNPPLITGCFVNGDDNSTSPTDVLIKINYDSPTETPIAQKANIGSTWGLAYNRTQRLVYAAAFLKRHVGLGENSGASNPLGAIYRVDPNSGPNGSLFFDLSTIDPGVGTIGSNVSRGLGNPTQPNSDPTAYDQVGKIGLGGMTISDDDQSLFVVSLGSQKLWKLSTSSPSSSPVSWNIPNPGCVGGNARPFAVNYHLGSVYVGDNSPQTDGQCSQFASLRL